MLAEQFVRQITMANPAEIQPLLAEINQLAGSFASSEGNPAGQCSPGSRQKLIVAARNLAATLEDDEDEVWRFAFAPGFHAIALVAWQRNVLAPWPKERMNASELSEQSKIDVVLIGMSHNFIAVSAEVGLLLTRRYQQFG